MSNLTVSFCSVRMDQHPDGTPRDPSRYLYVVFNGPVLAVSEGSRVHVRYLIYTDHPEAYAGCSVSGVCASHEQHRPASDTDLVSDH